MPHNWGNILVVTKDELIPKYYNSLSALKVEVHRYKDLPYGIKKVQKGGNGRQMYIDFDSLSKEVQDSMGDPRKMRHPLLSFFEFDATKLKDGHFCWHPRYMKGDRKSVV